MKKQKFNKDWVFHEGGGSSLAALAGGTEAAKAVTLPHDASVGMTRNPDEPNGSGNGFFREETLVYRPVKRPPASRTFSASWEMTALCWAIFLA